MRRQMKKLVFKKRLGQNILIEDSIIKKIIKVSGVNDGDVVLEIGPGLGSLTRELIKSVNFVYAVEKDPMMIEELKKEFSSIKNLKIIEGDVLEHSLVGTDPCCVATKFNDQPTATIKLIGNIPYSISSPILFWMIRNRRFFSTATLMVQKEVAQRICARTSTSEYGIVSVIIQTYCKPKMMFDVNPRCFRPVPKVTSTVVKFDFHEESEPDVDYDQFCDLVRGAFAQRRKMISNSLKSRFPRIEEMLIKSEISPTSRAEEISVERFIKLCKKMYHDEKTKIHRS